jgi:hypothetical protein
MLKNFGLLLIIIPLLFSCGIPNPFFIEFNKPANVEVIVSKEEGVSSWALSPEGDKIVYYQSNPPGVFLLFPASQQKHELSNCSGFRWLDNTLLQCGTDSSQKFIIDTTDFAKIPLQQVDERQIDIKELLAD